ncbi:MAG: hypothetical protein QOF13_1696 [Solirubrobacterales bacterium]|nr:hypothetical protein [Solirubrobacterales bacterium]
MLAVLWPCSTMTLPRFLFLLRFEDTERRVARARDEGARSGIFWFRRQGLAAVPHADRFFFRSFHRAPSRSRAGEQNRANEKNPRGSLPEPSHLTISTVRETIYQETSWVRLGPDGLEGPLGRRDDVRGVDTGRGKQVRRGAAAGPLTDG